MQSSQKRSGVLFDERQYEGPHSPGPRMLILIQIVRGISHITFVRDRPERHKVQHCLLSEQLTRKHKSSNYPKSRHGNTKPLSRHYS
eukprot:c18516_g2_i1 orf=85-345(-)